MNKKFFCSATDYLRRRIKKDKELLIKNIIGKVLKPEGFQYLEDHIEDKGTPDETFYFFRKVTNSKEETIRQMVSIQHAYGTEVYLNLYTSAAGESMYRIPNFVPDCEDDSFSFQTEEEYKEIMNWFAKILVKYGIPLLEKRKEPEISDYYTDEDKKMLFYEHERLLKDLLTREKITVEQFDVVQVADYIEKKVEEVKGKSFEEVRILFLELSALFGAVANQFYPCHWMLDEFLILSCDLKFPESKNVETGWESMSVLSTLFVKWKSKGFSRLTPKELEPEGIKKDLLKQYMYCTL